jgi:hypothetical protein
MEKAHPEQYKMRTLKDQSKLKIKSFPGLLTLSVVALISLFNNAIPDARAEPQMTAREAPLEGTHIYQLRVNSSGYGNIVLSCRRCPKNRIRLRVTPDSYALLGGTRIPMSLFTPGNSDFITGFYEIQTRELIWLQVARVR